MQSDQTPPPLRLTGTGVFLRYLHRVDEQLRQCVAFPLDLKMLPMGLVSGGVFLFHTDISRPLSEQTGASERVSARKTVPLASSNDSMNGSPKTVACRVLARVGYGSKRGFLASHIVANSLNIYQWLDGIAGLPHSLMPVHCSESSRMLSWTIESGLRLRHKATAIRFPFALKRSIDTFVLSVCGRTVYETEVRITGEFSLGLFTSTIQPRGVWQVCSGLPVGALFIRNAELIVCPTRPALFAGAHPLAETGI